MDMDDDPLSGYGLQLVKMTDQAKFRACFDTLSDPLSDYTFSQLFTWGNSLRILWKELRGHLCVFANGTGDLTLLMPPIGEGSSDAALAEAFEVMDAYNAAHQAYGRSRVEYVSDELLGRLDRSKLDVAPMGIDYLYDVNRMIDLAGSDLASKRQLKNRFMRNYEYRVEAYDAERHLEECRQLLRLWKNQQDAQHTVEKMADAHKRQKESLACELALDNAAALGLKGLVVYVRPRVPGAGELSIRGFTFGEYLGKDQSSIVIEKTDLGVKGLAQFIFSEFCGRCWADRPLVNAGDDWGLESLAWTKMSYRPVKLLQKHALRLAAPVAVSMAMSELGPRVPALQLVEASSPPFSIAPDGQTLMFPEPPMPLEAMVAGADASPLLAAAAVADAPAVVRSARREDLQAALQLEQACFSAHCLSKRQLGYLQQRPSAVFLVAEQGGRLVGQGIGLVRQHKRGQSGRIYSLAVSAEARRQKIGQRLLNAMIEGLTARGVRRIYLQVEQANAAAIRLYERNGFRSIGALPNYYGAGSDGLHMMYEAPVACPIMVDGP